MPSDGNADPGVTPPELGLGELVNHIYGVAISPDRIHELVAFWAQQVETSASRADGAAAARGDDPSARPPMPPGALPHIQRTEELLRSALRGSRDALDSTNAWVQQKQHAAFAVTRAGLIVAANAAAAIAFGVRDGSTIQDLAAAGEPPPGELVASLGPAPKLTQLRGTSHGTVHSAVLKFPIVAGSDLVGVTADFVDWPEALSDLLHESYRLTAAEIEVLQALIRGQSASAVAHVTGRSLATVRTHIHALISKTGTRNQLELIRLSLGLMSIAADPVAMPRPAPVKARNGNGWRRETQFEHVKLPDGRTRAYVETGDPAGRPFLLLPSPLGLFRFPRAVETGMARDRLRMVVPLRASLGPSSLSPEGQPVIESFAADTLVLMDKLGIRRAPVVCIGMDLLHGVTLANMAPERISAVIGAGAMLPVTEPAHMARLEAMSRFIFACTRNAPRVTNLMTLVFLYMGHFSGAAKPLRSMLKASPVDLALMNQAELCEAMTAGAPYNLSPSFAVHEACSREVEAFVADWRDALVSCRSPVVLLNGDRSPWNPVATLEEFAARSPNIRPVVLPDTGLMVAHHRPEAWIAEVVRWL